MIQTNQTFCDNRLQSLGSTGMTRGPGPDSRQPEHQRESVVQRSDVPPARSSALAGAERGEIDDDFKEVSLHSEDGKVTSVELPECFRKCLHGWKSSPDEQLHACIRCRVDRKVWVDENQGFRKVRGRQTGGFPRLSDETTKHLLAFSDTWKAVEDRRHAVLVAKNNAYVDLLVQKGPKPPNLKAYQTTGSLDLAALQEDRKMFCAAQAARGEALRVARLEVENTEFYRLRMARSEETPTAPVETNHVKPVEVDVPHQPKPEPEEVEQGVEEEVKAEEETQEQATLVFPVDIPLVKKLPLVGEVLGVESVRKRVTPASVGEKSVPHKRRKGEATDGRGQFSPWGWLQCKPAKERVYKEEPPDQSCMPVMPETLRRWLLMKDAEKRALVDELPPSLAAPKMPETLRQWVEAKDKEFALPGEPEPPDIPPLVESQGYIGTEKTTVDCVVLPSKPVPPDIPLWRGSDILESMTGGGAFVDVFVSYSHPPSEDPVPPDIP